MITSTIRRQMLVGKSFTKWTIISARTVRAHSGLASTTSTESIPFPGLYQNLAPQSVSKQSAPKTNDHKVKTPTGAMPPGYKAIVGELQTFELPATISGSAKDIELGKALIQAWRKDGILQIAMTPKEQSVYHSADKSSREFFAKPSAQKAACIDSLSYAGYIASGEEITDGIADYSEIFTVTKDLPLDDPRVVQKWPCHGRCPWPDYQMQNPISKYMQSLGENGDKLLKLIELGLNVPLGTISKLAQDGWHHLRILRFPANNKTNGKGKEGRGIGSHTDYGLLVIAAQDDVGGLFIRPPYDGENYANWNTSSAGLNENDEKWVYVPPKEGVFTVFPGDMMQYITNSFLPSTPHKVGLNTRERFAFAYFHEPNFKATLKPLPGYEGTAQGKGVHYGSHFTNMFIRNYPERITTQRLLQEGRYDMLNLPDLHVE